MSSAGAASRAAAPVSSARRGQSAQQHQSRGPKTEEGKARAAQNARSAACARRSTWSSRTRTAPSSPTSRRRWSQSWRRSVRCRRCSHGRWRSPPGASRGRPSCSRSAGPPRRARARPHQGRKRHAPFETLLRYRGAAMAEFWRALRTLNALQAEEAAQAEQVAVCGRTLARQPERRAALPLPSMRSRTNPRAAWGLHLSVEPSTPCPTGPGPAARCTSPRRPGRRTNPRPGGTLRHQPRRSGLRRSRMISQPQVARSPGCSHRWAGGNGARRTGPGR